MAAVDSTLLVILLVVLAAILGVLIIGLLGLGVALVVRLRKRSRGARPAEESEMVDVNGNPQPVYTDPATGGVPPGNQEPRKQEGWEKQLNRDPNRPYMKNPQSPPPSNPYQPTADASGGPSTSGQPSGGGSYPSAMSALRDPSASTGWPNSGGTSGGPRGSGMSGGGKLSHTPYDGLTIEGTTTVGSNYDSQATAGDQQNGFDWNNGPQSVDQAYSTNPKPYTPPATGSAN